MGQEALNVNDKSPSAFKTISEVAEEIGVPQHVLRFWENKFAQIQPLKRRGGRRYYRPEDVDRIKAIKKLLYEEGYTIKGAVRHFARKGNEIATPSVVAVAKSDKLTRESTVRAVTPVAAVPVAATPSAEGLSEEQREKLRTALDGLQEAKKLLSETM